MKTRDGSPLVVRRHAPEVVVVPDHADELTVEHAAAPPRRTLAVVLVGVLGLALVVTLALIWAVGREDEVTVQSPGAGAEGPATPAALSVHLDVPAQVVAGEPAEFVLHWRDGAGTFAGTIEDWGDGLGTGSVKVGACTGSEPAPVAGSGQVALQHTWSEPGTYTLAIGATTSTCAGTQVVMEDASATVTVEVVPQP